MGSLEHTLEFESTSLATQPALTALHSSSCKLTPLQSSGPTWLYQSGGQVHGGKEKDLDGDRGEELFLWSKKLFKEEGCVLEAIEGGDEYGIMQYKRACENRGVLPSMAVINSLQSTHIDFSHYLLGEHGGLALASALRVNSRVTSLKLRFAALSNTAAIALAKAVQKNPKACVQTLDLEGNGLGPEIGVALAELLSCNTTIKVLSIKGNHLRNLGCQKVLKTLAQDNHSLIELNLEKTGIGDPAGPALADCLRQNTCLKKLNLAWNSVAVAWGAVAEGLTQNRSLQILDVSFSNLLGPSGSSFCASFGHCSALKTLDLTDCRLDVNGFAALASAVMTNRNLETLVMDASAARGLLEAFAANRSSCKLAIRKSARSRAGEDELALEFDGQISGDFEVEAERRSSTVSTRSDLADHQKARLEAELTSAAKQLMRSGPEDPAQERVEQREQASSSGSGSSSADQALVESEVSARDSQEPPRREGSQRRAVPSLHLAFMKQKTEDDSQTECGRSRSEQQLDGTGAQESASDFPEASSEQALAESEEGAILEGTRLQALREAHASALERAREDPKDLDALQQAAEAASELRLYNEAALHWLKACSLTPNPDSRRGFQRVMELLLLERQRYAPPKRIIYLKVKNLDNAPLLLRAASTFSLTPELEAVLDNLQDLLERGGDPEQAKAQLRVAVRDTEDELRGIFAFYATGGAAEETNCKPETMPLRFFWRFARDCQFLSRPLSLCEIDRIAALCQPSDVRDAAASDPHNGARALAFPCFVELLCRLSWVLHPNLRSLPERFEHCVRAQVRAHARKDSRGATQMQVSAAAGGPYVEKHRLRLLKIFRHFCTDFADAAAEAHVAHSDADSSASHSPTNQSRTLRGTPLFDREKESPRDASARSRFADSARTADAPGSNSPNEPLTARRKAAKALDGSLSARSNGSDDSPRSARALWKGAAASASLVVEEGPGYMTFNDLMRLAEKMVLYSPQLNLQKVKSIVEKLICFPDLMPQQHMHNLRSRIIFEEFVEILARFAASAREGAMAQLHKEPDAGWRILEEFLEESIYPMAKKILPGRL